MKTYSGEKIPLLGMCEVKVEYEDTVINLPVIVAVVKGTPPILSRSWIAHLNLDMQALFGSHVNTTDCVNNDLTLDDVLTKHSSLFEDKLGTIKGVTAKIKQKSGVTPKFVKARPVPYALKSRVEKELDKLETDGVISKVNFSEWATPIVIVPHSLTHEHF